MKYLGVLLLIFLVSCFSGAEDFFKKAPHRKVQTELVFEQDSAIFIGNTHLFSVVDSFIFISDKYGDKNFTIINTQNGHAARICPVGQGPGDAINPSVYVTILKNKNNELLLCILDITYGKWLVYDLNHVLIDNQTVAFKSIPIESESLEHGGLSRHIEMLNDSVWIGTGIYFEGVFSFFKNGIRKKEMVDFSISDPSLNKLYKSVADANIFDISSDKKYLVRSAAFAGLIELYSIDSDTLINKFSREYFKQEYGVSSDGRVGSNKSSRYGYISVCISSDKVYGLYSGKTQSEPDSYQSQYIHVYDFNGSLLEIITLDVPVCAMDMNSTGDIIYLLSATGERKVLSVKI